MKHGWLAGLTTVILGSAIVTISASDPGVSLIGVGGIPGNASDKSGLAGSQICQRDDVGVCIDQATFGGLGSAVTYTGFGDVFLAVPDRGPFDGRTNVPYLDRFHFLNITVDTNAAFPNIKTVLLDTRFLTDEKNRNLVGDAYAFDTHPRARRFDPEGVAVSIFGSFFVSDEYGAFIFEFDRNGQLVRRIDVPEKFQLDPKAGNPSGDLDGDGNSFELYPTFNVTGRQANRGMEGLTITPNGRTLVGIMQNALLQDHGVAPTATSMGRVGLNNRILTLDLLTGTTHEYVYVMDAVNQGRGVNEMLAINDHEFLVLERDNRTRVPTPPSTSVQTPNLKRIYKIDLAKPGLTDVSGIASLPQSSPDPSIVPVTKTLFLDLLDTTYMANATQPVRDVIAEKIEGMAWGPDLQDGRHALDVFSDNDLFPGLPTQIYAFAIDEVAAGIKFRRQLVLFPPFGPCEILNGLLN